MDAFFVFIIRFDIPIYIICAFGLFWYLIQWQRGQSILRQAMFGLEQETGTALRNNAFIYIVIFTLVISTVYYVNSQIAPTLPPELLRPPTPTPDIFVTPLTSPTPLGAPEIQPPTATPPLVPTVTLPSNAIDPRETASSNETAVSQPTATPFIGCTAVLNLSDPRNGGIATGSITFIGTANTDNFQYFELEANGPQTNGQWASLTGRSIEQPIIDGILGTANLEEWASGPYLIRLTAVNNDDGITGQCIIQITVNNN